MTLQDARTILLEKQTNEKKVSLHFQADSYINSDLHICISKYFFMSAPLSYSLFTVIEGLTAQDCISKGTPQAPSAKVGGGL